MTRQTAKSLMENLDLLRQDFHEIQLMYPVSLHQLAREIDIPLYTLHRFLMSDKKICLENAIKIQSYINKKKHLIEG